MRHALALFLLLCFAPFTRPVCAQTVDELKRQVNSIKKSSDFIYGQAAGEDEQVAYDIAYELFQQKVKAYVQADSVLKNAEAVLLPTIKSRVKKISFERHINSRVVCLYVSKKDIQPLYKENIIPIAPPAPDTLALPKEAVDTIASKPAPAADSLALPKELPDTAARMPAQRVEEKDALPAERQSEPADTVIVVKDAKASALLTEVARAGVFDEIKRLLEKRKQSAHDIMFGATMRFAVQNAYWAVFDKNKTLIALLDPQRRTDLLTDSAVSASAYAAAPKIWIQIY